jgi:Transposase IS200 like
MPDPLYTPDNVRIAYELRWSIALFWNQPAIDFSDWLEPLKTATEPDGVRVLEHHLAKKEVSQFLVSTKPHVSLAQCLRSIKGRLQYLIRGTMPKAFKRNYSITSIGTANQEVIESYVADQLDHHRMADPRVDAMLVPFQFTDVSPDLANPRRSSHGEFIHNLHLVAVNDGRYAEISEKNCRRTFEMLQRLPVRSITCCQGSDCWRTMCIGPLAVGSKSHRSKWDSATSIIWPMHMECGRCFSSDFTWERLGRMT